MFTTLTRTIITLLMVCLPVGVVYANASSYVDDPVVSLRSDSSNKSVITIVYKEHSDSLSVTSMDVSRHEVRIQDANTERFIPWSKINQVELVVVDWSALNGVLEQAIWYETWPEPVSWTIPSLRYSINGVTRGVFAISKAWRTPDFLVLATEVQGGVKVQIIRYSALDWFEAVARP